MHGHSVAESRYFEYRSDTSVGHLADEKLARLTLAPITVDGSSPSAAYTMI
jgi:hypothetical protein